MSSILIGKCNKDEPNAKMDCQTRNLVLKRIAHAFKKHNINVVHLKTDVKQLIWVRDVYIPIDNTYVIGNLTRKSTLGKNRVNEYKELEYLLDSNPEIEQIKPSKDVKLEGGDIIQYKDYIFVGIGGRTNKEGYEFIKRTFKHKKVIAINHTALHLDCVLCVLDNDVVFYDSKYIQRLPRNFRQLFNVNDISSIVDSGKFLATNFVKIGKTLIISNTPENSAFRDILKGMGYKLEIVNTENIWRLGGSVRCLTQWLL